MNAFWEDLAVDLTDPEYRAAHESSAAQIEAFDVAVNTASTTAALPADWEHRGVRLPHSRGRDVLVAPDTITALLRGKYVGGGRSLSRDIAEALTQAGWAESTFRGHRASYALRRDAQ